MQKNKIASLIRKSQKKVEENIDKLFENETNIDENNFRLSRKIVESLYLTKEPLKFYYTRLQDIPKPLNNGTGEAYLYRDLGGLEVIQYIDGVLSFRNKDTNQWERFIPNKYKVYM